MSWTDLALLCAVVHTYLHLGIGLAVLQTDVDVAERSLAVQSCARGPAGREVLAEALQSLKHASTLMLAIMRRSLPFNSGVYRGVIAIQPLRPSLGLNRGSSYGTCLKAQLLAHRPWPRFIQQGWHQSWGLGQSLITKAARKGPSCSKDMPPEARVFWQDCLEALTRPAAISLAKLIYPDHLLGIPPTHISRFPPCYEYFYETKRKHPQHIVVTRVGKFYEAIGPDAIMLVEYCGLNPMQPHGSIPRAGFPAAHIQSTLTALTNAGFQVVVSEEVVTNTPFKQRYIAKVVTLHDPDYGGWETIKTAGIDPPAIKGVAYSKRGFKLFAYDRVRNVVSVNESLTAEALLALLNASGVSPPLVVHDSIKDVKGGSLTVRTLPSLVRDMVGQQVAPGRQLQYYGGDMEAGFCRAVCRVENLAADEPIPLVAAEDGEACRPAPLYMSTVMQLGLGGAPGIPPLLDALVDARTCPSLARAWLRVLHLLPPPPHIAYSIHGIVQQLNNQSTPLPMMSAKLAPKKLVRVLAGQEGTAEYFQAVDEMLQPMLALLESEQLTSIAEKALILAGWSQQRALVLPHLREALQRASRIISAVVDVTSSFSDLDSASEAEEPIEEDEAGSGAVENEAYGLASVPVVLHRLSKRHELFHGKLHPDLIREASTQVDSARLRISAELQQMIRMLAPPAGLRAPRALHKKNMLKAKYNDLDRMVWLWVPSGHPMSHKCSAAFHPARDRNTDVVKNSYTTPELQDAMQEYRDAVQEANTLVREELRKLCGRLSTEPAGSPLSLDLAAACEMSIVMTALDQHVREARLRGWCTPHLTSGTAQGPGGGTSSEGALRVLPPVGPLEIVDMWPFWCQRDSSTTVKNSLNLQNMMLLTGANMAGKSTMLRSTCAVALLANCGLMVPAVTARVPFYDAYMLRNFSGDSPLEGKSSFALEMDDMRCVVQDSSHRSLVLLDEMGKGTEVNAGTALAAAMLEELATTSAAPGSSCASTIFATHLHGLVDLTAGLVEQGLLSYQAMEVLERQGQLVPTWRMVPGVCLESLAFDVAGSCGVPTHVVGRARTIYKQLTEQQHVGLARQPLPAADIPAAVPTSSRTSADWVFEVEEEEESGGSRSDGAEADLQEAAALVQDIMLRTDTSGPSGSRSNTISNNTTNADANSHVDDHLVSPLVAASSSSSTPRSSTHDSSHVGSSYANASRVATAAAAAAAAAEPAVIFLTAKEMPPVNHSMRAAVYVLRSPLGWFYVGETDDIAARLRRHRRRNKLKPHMSGPSITAAYVLLPQDRGGKSGSRCIQTAAIQELQQAGFPLASSADGKLLRFAK